MAEALVSAMALQGALAAELRQAGQGGVGRSANNPVRRLSLVTVVPETPARPPAKDKTTPAGRLEIFRDQLTRRELNAKTITLYVREVQRADRWCADAGYSLLNVPGLLVTEYVAVRPKGYATRRVMRVSLTHYWKVFKRKDPPTWAIRVPRKPRMICRALEDHEAAKLAALAIERGGTKGFAVLLGLYQALRREEISTVAWGDFTDDGWLKLVGKGEVTARIPLHSVVATALAELPREHPVWVFPGRVRGTREQGHVCAATIWAWVVAMAVDAGIEHMTTHRLRHTCLAMANDVSGDLRSVQDFARHARIDTTSGYTRTTSRRLKAVVASVSYEPGAAERHAIEHRVATKLAGLSGPDLAWIEAAVEELAGELSESKP